MCIYYDIHYYAYIYEMRMNGVLLKTFNNQSNGHAPFRMDTDRSYLERDVLLYASLNGG